MKTNKTRIIFAAVIAYLCTFACIAQALDNGLVAAFQSFKDVPALSIEVPTVVEIPFDQDYIGRYNFAVYENETETFQPSYFNTESAVKATPIMIQTQTSSGAVANLTDGRHDTHVEYALPETYQGKTEIKMIGSKPITSSALTILLDDHVARPTSIEIRTVDGERSSIVLAKTGLHGQTVNFMETTAKTWIVSLEYTQPLRITEMRLVQKDVESTTRRGLRFLARPEHTYRIYFNPDRSVAIETGESSNLSDDKEVLRIEEVKTQSNSLYTKADIDEDGVPDEIDNCVSVKNSDQIDVNSNGRGDACDDFDRDGVINTKDNCPDHPNRKQVDTDADGIGDVCDDEESRITEKYVWLPWAGMGLAVLVILVLFAFTVKGMLKKPEETIDDGTEKGVDTIGGSGTVADNTTNIVSGENEEPPQSNP